MIPRGDLEYRKFDLSSGGLVCVSDAEASIHKGDGFFVKSFGENIPSSAVLYLTLTSPPADKQADSRWSFEASGEFTIELLEDVTSFTLDQPTVIQNANRNSSNASIMSAARASAIVGGTVIWGDKIGENRTGSGRSDTDKFMIKSDTIYTFRIINNSSQDEWVSWDISWHEYDEAHQ